MHRDMQRKDFKSFVKAKRAQKTEAADYDVRTVALCVRAMFYTLFFIDAQLISSQSLFYLSSNQFSLKYCTSRSVRHNVILGVHLQVP